MRFLKSAAGAIALSLLAATAHAQVNLLVNGSFESDLDGWTTNGFLAQDFDYGIDGYAQSGSKAFYGGVIEGLGFLNQTFATVAGQSYSLDFWLASDGFLPNQFKVIANGRVLFDAENVMIQPYTAQQLTFQAIGPTTYLQFGFRSDPGLLHLDNVSVTAIPEPETAALMALGLAALALSRRRLSS